MMLPACGGNAAPERAPPAEPPPPALECDEEAPQAVDPVQCNGAPVALNSGDASWPAPPFAPPSDDEDEDEDDGDDGEDNGDDGGGSFLIAPDGGAGGVFECDVWAQDCPRGEKCVPWGSDGGGWNATRCSEVMDMPGVDGDACVVEGGPHSGLDDCGIGSVCWGVDAANSGACVSQCVGSAESPLCDPGSWCFVGYGGSVAVCLSEEACKSDGACECKCPEGADPDCSPDQCEVQSPAHPDVPARLDDIAVTCPEVMEPVVLYMSNDDSNSQGSPIVARQLIQAGELVPAEVIRVHEFVNYFEFLGEAPSDGSAANVSMQLRRTNARLGEFGLVLNVQAEAQTPATRPRMNVVFSLDTSGSMAGDPIARLKDTMLATAGNLRAGDVVSLVSWSSEAAVLLDGLEVTGPDDPILVAAVEGVAADGSSTDLHTGLVSAYALARAHLIAKGLNRVVLVSDGGANAGVLDISLIAGAAASEDGGGIYLVGVGVGVAGEYRDDLMDTVTDAGKGAYVYIDTTVEAEKQFGVRFLANMSVAARNVQMQVTLPWYFGVKKFNGEEISSEPSEVEPQHLAPNDSMTFHQIVAACDPALVNSCDPLTARVDYLDPLTGSPAFDDVTVAIGDLVQYPDALLRKADVVVAYAESLLLIAGMLEDDEFAAALHQATLMENWVRSAAQEMCDPELAEVADLLHAYAGTLADHAV